jgi:hypothetical protein
MAQTNKEREQDQRLKVGSIDQEEANPIDV